MIVPGLGDLSCFACATNKSPLTASWPKDARRIEPLRHWPSVGVPTGDVNGFDAVDVDPNGLAWLAANRYRLPLTREHETPRGRHLLFRHMEGMRNSKGWIALGVDVRGDGGYVVWHPRRYPVLNADVIAEWPEWLLVMLAQGHSVEGHTGLSAPVCVSETGEIDTEECEPMPTSSLKLRSKAIIERVARTQPGARNNMLFWGAKRHGELIAEGRIKREVAVTLLVGAAKINGLWRDGDTAEEQADAPRKVMATIESGIARGIARWRTYTQDSINRPVCPPTDATSASFLDRT
jgi:Bifunctional DNA primase/polymerase, N-terminal